MSKAKSKQRTEGSSGAIGSALRGRAWKAVINGQRSVNGARHSITLTGDIKHADEWSTIIDVIHDLAEHIEENTRNMEIKDSFQITLYPPNNQVRHGAKEQDHE